MFVKDWCRDCLEFYSTQWTFKCWSSGVMNMSSLSPTVRCPSGEITASVMSRDAEEDCRERWLLLGRSVSPAPPHLLSLLNEDQRHFGLPVSFFQPRINRTGSYLWTCVCCLTQEKTNAITRSHHRLIIISFREEESRVVCHTAARSCTLSDFSFIQVHTPIFSLPPVLPRAEEFL